MKIEAVGLAKNYSQGRAAFGDSRTQILALRGVSLSIESPRSLGLVGESGGGKSTLVRHLLGLEAPDYGMVLVDGEDLAKGGSSAAIKLRSRVGFLMQDPFTSLDPMHPIWRIVTEPVVIHNKVSSKQRRDTARKLLATVGLSAGDADRFPDQFSGGQRQRIALARALSSDPEILLLDEPVASLDVSVQAQIVVLLLELKKSRGLGYLVISHDLPTVGVLCDDIAVLYQGRIVEQGPGAQILKNPGHPYTAGLIQSRPSSTQRDLLPTADPGLLPAQGCPYAPRCPVVQDLCKTLDPPMFHLTEEHQAACLFPLKS